jgi:hypothetical protein
MSVRFALQQMRLNVPALTYFRPHFVAGLGTFCHPFHNLLIELTGKALAVRANRWHRDIFWRRGFGKSFRKL